VTTRAILAAITLAAGCGHVAPPPRSAVESRIDRAGIRQVWVPPGTFVMGSDDESLAALRAQEPPKWVARELDSERPAHRVRLTTGFWIDANEVTNAAFQDFVAAGGYERRSHWSDAGWAWLAKQDRSALPARCVGTEPELPRRCVTWFEAEAYAAWRGGRLPTEAEWEYAARGPRSLRYPWGNEFDPLRCNVVDSSGPTPVGRYPAGVSWVGAHDMAGNAMEWVSDWLGPYDASRGSDPKGPATGSIKVEKGGWWGANPFVARSAYRHYEDPAEYGDKHIGFRIVSGGTGRNDGRGAS
jgi:formylglycine-generating enzyme required for sulfatase activity